MNMPDLTRTESGQRSIAKRFEPLVQNACKYRNNVENFKKEIISILDDPTTVASKEEREKYKTAVKKFVSFNSVCMFVTNVYLAGAKMKLNV